MFYSDKYNFGHDNRKKFDSRLVSYQVYRFSISFHSHITISVLKCKCYPVIVFHLSEKEKTEVLVMVRCGDKICIYNEGCKLFNYKYEDQTISPGLCISEETGR